MAPIAPPRRTRRRLTAPASLFLLAFTAACSGDGRSGGPPAPGLDSPDNRGALSLFISPAGQPFHAKPDEPYPVSLWFAQADRDHDGRLSLAEFTADAEAFFATLDANHDGVIDGFEIADYEKSLPEIQPRLQGLLPGEGTDLALGQPDDGTGRPHTPQVGLRPPAVGGAAGRQGASVFGLLDDPEPVSAADADFDSRVTLAEERAMAARRFALLDANHDGWLTLAELPPTPVQAFAAQAAKRKAAAGSR